MSTESIDTNEWLTTNGFQKVGEFVEKHTNGSGVGVDFIDSKFVSSENDWIYAIVFDGIIKYIGETAQTLAQRIRLYYLEARTDSTNSSMRVRLKELLPKGYNFEIYAQKAPIVHHNGKDIKLRVDLEISLIKEIRPEWNKKGLYS